MDSDVKDPLNEDIFFVHGAWASGFTDPQLEMNSPASSLFNFLRSPALINSSAGGFIAAASRPVFRDAR
jgi:hypothetical protein